MTQPLAQMPNHPLVDSVAGLRGVLDVALEAPDWCLSDGEVRDLISEVNAAVGQLHAMALRLAYQVDTRDLARAEGATSTAALLRARLLLPPEDASQTVRLARGLAGEFTATFAALCGGRISRAHAEAITASVRALPGEVPMQVRRDAEAALIEQSTRFDPRDVRRLGRHILAVVDPDLADRLLAKRLAKDEAKAKARNELQITPDGTGGSRLRGRLDAESEAILKAALDPLAAPLTGADGPDPRSHTQRMGDALVELCRRALTHGDLPDNGGEKPAVVITIDYHDLRDRLRAAQLDTGEALSPQAARRLACDARLIPAVLGGPGQVLDLGRACRLFTGPQRRALILRDGGCAFPGCDRPPAWCIGHHIKHWIDGGETSLTNGVLLCGHHHIVIHKGDWKVHMPPDGYPHFIPPPWIDPQHQPQRNTRHHIRR